MYLPIFGDSRLNREAVGGVISGPFSNVNNFQPEVHSDVISSGFVDPAGLKVLVKFGDSRSNSSQDIRLPHFVTNDDNDDDNDSDVGRRTL